MPCKVSSLIVAAIFFLKLNAIAQGTLYGTVSDGEGNPIEGANISIVGSEKGTSTDSKGAYRLIIPSNKNVFVEFSHLTFTKDTFQIHLNDGESRLLDVKLHVSDIYLQQVEVQGNVLKEEQIEVSSFSLNPLSAKEVVSPFNDFNTVLITLPGVVSNSELSSNYSVRGGNFDENLVYVNDVPIYRPLLVRTGQQEGLSFVNPDLVSNIDFYAGGWDASYGDKLSSVLDIQYKKPTATAGSIELSLLGGSAHFEKKVNDKWNFAIGVRNKNAKYLLNSLEVQGEYLPNFTDVQGVVNYSINSKNEIGALFAYASNNYLVTPASQETDFGFFDLPLRLFVAFEGQEKLKYNTLQSGVFFTTKSDKWENKTILSGYYSTEREFFDVEGAYRLCILEKDISKDNFDQCLINRGVGSNYRSGRNFLDVESATIENKSEIRLDHINTVELGAGFTYQHFDDSFNEFSFKDSSDYVFINEAIKSKNELATGQFFLYANHNARIASNHNLSYGVRMNYHNVTEQLLIDPRIRYAFTPLKNNDLVYRFAAGIYHQTPYYREFRDRQGTLNKDIKAQASLHFIAGFDKELSMWGRPFKFTAEGYYKYLWDVNPYDIDNVKIRYYSNNDAKAYVAGFDMRISGEFVADDQSWFSLGIMRTKEDQKDDGSGYVFRPTDQLINAAIFFQDHIPNLPTYKMHLTFFYNTPLPFYAPNSNREHYFRGEPYQRVDIGFSKDFQLKNDNLVVIGLEVLNLTNSNNTISYSWIQDISGNYFALPNRLSQRYFNVRAKYNF